MFKRSSTSLTGYICRTEVKMQPPNKKNTEIIKKELLDAWKSGIVSRSEIGLFSGGVLHPRTMANRDSNGTGIKPFFKCGRKVFYRTEDAAQYLLNQIDG